VKKILGSLSALTSLASLVFVSASVGDILSGASDTSTGVLVGLLIFFSGTAVMSGYLAKRALLPGAAEKKGTDHAHETAILKLAMERGGRLNIAQIATLTPLSVEEARAAVKTLSAQGVAEVEFSEGGEVYYRFAGLQDPGSGPLGAQSAAESEADPAKDKVQKGARAEPTREM